MAKDDVTTLKKSILEKIELATPGQLQEVMDILNDDPGEDWWHEVPDNIKENINQSLAEAENGQITEHQDVVKKHAPWLAK